MTKQKSIDNLIPFTKNDARINRKGRPKVPKNLKEFIKELEDIENDILIPVQACEFVTIKGVDYYRINSSSGYKLAMAIYNKALKGDLKALDWMTRMGYAGGYEPIKKEITGKDGTPLNPPNEYSLSLITTIMADIISVYPKYPVKEIISQFVALINR